GPLSGTKLPILISLSVAPTSYFFWAEAALAAKSPANPTATNAAKRHPRIAMLISRDCRLCADLPAQSIEAVPGRRLAIAQPAAPMCRACATVPNAAKRLRCYRDIA